MKKCDTELEKQIIELYQNGMPMSKVGKKVNKSPTTVYNILHRNGIVIRTKGGIYQLNEKEIVTYYKQGNSAQKLADKYNVSFGTIRNVLEKHGIKRDNRYHNLSLDTKYWSSIDTYDKAYFLGLMITDGNVCGNAINLSLKKNDCRIIKVFAQKTHNSNKLHEDKRGKGMIGSGAKCKEWANDLLKHNVYPNKTYTTSFPNTVDDSLMPHFIRGLIDGDGWISSKSHSIGFCGSEKIVTQLRDILVKKLNVFNVKVLHTEPHLWMVNWSSNKDIKAIGEFIYKDKKDCYLERKYNNYLTLINANTEVSSEITKGSETL